METQGSLDKHQLLRLYQQEQQASEKLFRDKQENQDLHDQIKDDPEEALLEGEQYQCHSCDYQATEIKKLERCLKSRHQTRKYQCDLCDYQAIQRGHLKTYQKSIHGGTKFQCDSCIYKRTTKRSLNRHQMGYIQMKNTPVIYGK